MGGGCHRAARSVFCTPGKTTGTIRSRGRARSRLWPPYHGRQPYYVGGFGVMGWISASEYGRSRPDPLADSMADIIQHMNADHKDALAALARGFARIESQEATMTAVDRLGFHVRLKTQDGIRGTRIAFPREVSNPAETRKVLVEMVQQARSRAE